MARPLAAPKGNEYVRVRRSTVHGRGLFAACDIPKGTRIIEYLGEKVSKSEGERRAQKQWRRGRIYVFRLNQRYDLDGAPSWNVARLANHSCDPTAESENQAGRRIWIVALRDIKEGEEITFDYHLDFDEEPIPCRCGAARCVGYIVASDQRHRLRAWVAGKSTRGTAAPLRRGSAKGA